MTSTVPRVNYEPLLWLGLGATFFLTARLIGRQLTEVIRLNDTSEDNALRESNTRDQLTQSTSPTYPRQKNKKKSKTPEDRISLDILKELAFSSSYDIREATNKIIAERWARDWNCKNSLFVSLDSECVLKRDEGEFIVNVLRDYNIDPEPQRSHSGPTLQTLEDVLNHAHLDSNSPSAIINPMMIPVMEQVPGSDNTESVWVTDLTRLIAPQTTEDVLDPAQIEQPTGDLITELHRTSSHATEHNMDDVWTARHHGDVDLTNDEEMLPEMPHPRPLSMQSPEEIERRRGRREAVVIGLETENGEAETVRVVRPGADTLEFRVRRVPSTSRARSQSRGA